ncbi:MAG: hypothetical protein OXP66_05330 [Candidatus Tectomicrobia bacterium]|nr:hypothetical protein [Candidatus Tectomicrobia bacterium]
MVNGAVTAFERISIKYWRVAVVAWLTIFAFGVFVFGPVAVVVGLMCSNIGFAIGFFISMRKVVMSFNYWWLGVVAWVIVMAFGAVALGPLGLIFALMSYNIWFFSGVWIGIRQGLWLWGEI